MFSFFRKKPLQPSKAVGMPRRAVAWHRPDADVIDGDFTVISDRKGSVKTWLVSNVSTIPLLVASLVMSVMYFVTYVKYDGASIGLLAMAALTTAMSLRSPLAGLIMGIIPWMFLKEFSPYVGEMTSGGWVLVPYVGLISMFFIEFFFGKKGNGTDTETHNYEHKLNMETVDH